MAVFNLEKTPDAGVEKVGETGTVYNPDTLGQIEKPTANATEPAGKQAETKVVVMTGPLGHVYTQALNQLYAQESMANDAMLLAEQVITSGVGNQEADVYVYACDCNELEKADLSTEYDKLRIALDNKAYKSKVVVMESNGLVTRRMVLLGDFAKKNGATVIHTRKTALESIRIALCNHHA